MRLFSTPNKNSNCEDKGESNEKERESINIWRMLQTGERINFASAEDPHYLLRAPLSEQGTCEKSPTPPAPKFNVDQRAAIELAKLIPFKRAPTQYKKSSTLNLGVNGGL